MCLSYPALPIIGAWLVCRCSTVRRPWGPSGAIHTRHVEIQLKENCVISGRSVYDVELARIVDGVKIEDDFSLMELGELESETRISRGLEVHGSMPEQD